MLTVICSPGTNRNELERMIFHAWSERVRPGVDSAGGLECTLGLSTTLNTMVTVPSRGSAHVSAAWESSDQLKFGLIRGLGL